MFVLKPPKNIHVYCMGQSVRVCPTLFRFFIIIFHLKCAILSFITLFGHILCTNSILQSFTGVLYRIVLKKRTCVCPVTPDPYGHPRHCFFQNLAKLTPELSFYLQKHKLGHFFYKINPELSGLAVFCSGVTGQTHWYPTIEFWLPWPHLHITLWRHFIIRSNPYLEYIVRVSPY